MEATAQAGTTAEHPRPVKKALRKAVRTALPGPWRARLVLQEAGGALLLGTLALLIELAAKSGPVVLTALATVVLFLLRRGLPATVLVLTAAACGWAGGPMPLLIAAGWSAGARLTRVGVLVGSFSVALTLLTAIGLVKDAGVVPIKLLLGLSLGSFLLLGVLPALWGRYRAQRRALTDALRERNQQLLRERAMVAHQARLRERHRIAQDMHDSLGHQLALISVHSGALEVDRTLTDRQREAVGVLRLAAVAAMRELREVVGVLHDESTATEPAAGGGAGAGGAAVGGVNGIERLVESSRAAGTDVALSRDGESRTLPAAVDHAAFRTVQEALTNAHKHAPGAPISVALRWEPDALVVEVANAPVPARVGAGPGADGPSGAPDGRVVVSGGQGLTGLRERARLVGGMLHAGATPDGGFRLAAVLPYGGSADGAPADGGAGADGFDPADRSPGADPFGGGTIGADPFADDTTGDRAMGGGTTGGGATAPGAADRFPAPGAFPAARGADAGARRRRSPVLGCAIGGLAVLMVIAGLVAWGVMTLVRSASDATVPKPLYDSIKVGAPEDEVRRKLPPGENFFTRDYAGTGPTPPEGSVCSYFMSGETSGQWDEDNVARFCFKDGVLVEKQQYLTKTKV
ncbi:sensor histidine kinase [Kitasatospora sp. NPDC054939]